MPRKKKEKAPSDHLGKLAAEASLRRRNTKLDQRWKIETEAWQEINALLQEASLNSNFSERVVIPHVMSLAEPLIDLREPELVELLLDYGRVFIARQLSRDIADQCYWTNYCDMIQQYRKAGLYTKGIAAAHDLLVLLRTLIGPPWTPEQTQMYEAFDAARGLELSFDSQGKVVATPAVPAPNLSKEQEQWCKSHILEGDALLHIKYIEELLQEMKEKQQHQQDVRQHIERFFKRFGVVVQEQ